jgi:hypothetical protein
MKESDWPPGARPADRSVFSLVRVELEVGCEKHGPVGVPPLESICRVEPPF